MYIPKDLLPVEARENTLRKVEEVLSRFAKDGVPLLDPEEDMKVQSKSFRKATRRIEALEGLFEKHDIRGSPHIQQKLKVLHAKQELSAKIKSIKKTMRSSTALAFKDELKARKRVLRRLGYVTSDDVGPAHVTCVIIELCSYTILCGSRSAAERLSCGLRITIEIWAGVNPLQTT